MIIVLQPGIDNADAVVAAIERTAGRFGGVSARLHRFLGESLSFAEVHLIGPTESVPESAFESIPGVHRVVRVSRRYRLIGRHSQSEPSLGFTANGVPFGDDHVNVFAGLCAVDSRESVRQMMVALQGLGITTTRMGAYKPRTSPYDFQGLGAACLPFVFELAGAHGIKLIAMEVTHAQHLDEIDTALRESGEATAVMVQIGTRNTQNFELLKAVGQQRFPVLFKRGMGITLEESLNACEYVASEGNRRIVFCLRGVKTHLGEPHRNMVDFAHVPVVRRLTRLPVCIDPSHSVGSVARDPEGISDVWHATGQGILAGAQAVLVDFHPDRSKALCDGPQALELRELPGLLDHIARVRAVYEAVRDRSIVSTS